MSDLKLFAIAASVSPRASNFILAGDNNETLSASYESGLEIIINIPTPEEIRKTRKEAGLTQTQAAKLVYRSLRTWQDYESGHTPIDLAVWKLFLIEVNITPDFNRTLL